EVIQTHMSWVFLTDSYAYKLKKPIRDAYRDLRTPEQRRRHAQEEVRLNRRLAAGVYLDVVALTAGNHGALTLTDGGAAVDWLIWMRRLPAGASLHRVLETGPAGDTALRQAVEHLARFFTGEAPRAGFTADAYRQRLRRDLDSECGMLGERVPRESLEPARAPVTGFLDEYGGLLGQRAAAGRIVEGHGDLRPEHVYLLKPPVVIDCLEFSRTLRLLDPADEIAFLALECERLGAADTAARILSLYPELSGDRPPARLFHFYQAFRGLVRARLAALHAEDPGMDHSDHWRQRADDYLERAARHGRRALE
ncbi:MAG TPA: hypothetical protein VKA64_00420, partial [Gammaproteobacteria bacterium]|nr:hypothetical protein [Gammaproteobacteria bacterium]